MGMNALSCADSIDFSRLPRPVVAEHPEWVALHDAAWRLAAGHIRRGRGRRHMDAAWSREVNYQWVWDTCFMALYARYGADQFPGVESLDNFYELQREDGYIGMTYDLDSGREPWPDRINPPLFAWVEWMHYRATGDDSRLARAAGHIERLMNWIDENRRTPPHRRRASRKPEAGAASGTSDYRLYYFTDGGSSGMDDSPRTPRVHEAGRHFDWIDLSSQMALSFRLLGKMHGVLGQREAAAAWERRARETGALINAELWCERTGFYHDRGLPKNFVASKTVAGFWPILAGVCPPERLDALVEHLGDERTFARPTPVPSLAAEDPNYDPEGTYWVGGVWAPTNYMVARGLLEAGRGATAHGIALKYLGALARTYAEVDPHTLWECYSPEADRPGRTAYDLARVKPDFVGWSGLGPIAMLIENVIGLDVDAPAAEVCWDIRLSGEHGVRALPVGNGARADFLCAAREAAEAPARLTIRSEREITVFARRGAAESRIAVVPGGECVAEL